MMMYVPDSFDKLTTMNMPYTTVQTNMNTVNVDIDIDSMTLAELSNYVRQTSVPVPMTVTSDPMCRDKLDPMVIDHLTLFESMEGRNSTEMAKYMIIPPVHGLRKRTPLSRRPSKHVLVQMFLKRMRRNPRLPYTYSHCLTTPSCPDTFVIADPTRNKKGLFPKTCVNRYCVKQLRSRTILVFNIEWLKPSPEVKKEVE